MPLNRPDYLNDPGQGFIGQQLDALMPGATGLLGLMDIKPDRDLWNLISGNPYGYQQSAMGGNNTMADIRLSEARKAFKMTLDDDADERFRQQALQGYYRVLGFDQATSAERAENRYSPTGLLSSFAMRAYEFDEGRENLTQGFLEMNLTPITPGIIDEATMGSEYVSRQRRMQAAARDFAKDLENTYAADPAQFGNLTYGETGEVFAQMAARDTLSIRNITGADGGADDTRIRQTTSRVAEMSRAVDAMQELFGGTIPEVFDKLDQVFGGSASAMGGRELEGRVRELKQLSAVSGQSVQATAQMIQVGQQYAQQAGFDSGIGTSAAMVTTAQLGVNVDSSGFNMRRVDMEQVRALSLRNNVGAATSNFAQYYAGARQIYIEQQRQQPGRENATDDELSEEFFNRTANVRSLEGLAAVTGTSGQNIAMMAMSEEARIAMMDDRRVAMAASRGDVMRETTEVGSGIIRTLSNRGIDIQEEDVFEEVEGQRIVRGGQDIINRVLERGGDTLTESQRFAVRGLVTQAGEDYASIATNSNLNLSSFNVRQRQQVGGERMRDLAIAQAQFEQDMAEFAGPGGFMGIMNFLADASFGDAERLEGLDKAQIDAMAGFNGKNFDDLTDEQKAVFKTLPPTVQERYKSDSKEARIKTANEQRDIYAGMSDMTRERYDRLDAGQRLRISQRQETFGGLVNSFLGAVDPSAANAADRERMAKNFVTAAVSAFGDADAAQFNPELDFGGKDFDQMDEFEQERFNILAERGEIDKEEYADMSVEEREALVGAKGGVTRERLGVIFNSIADRGQMREILADRTQEEKKEAAKLIREGALNKEDPNREENIKKLAYFFGTDKFRAREDLRDRLETAGTDYESFDMTTGEGKRDALVKASLVGKDITSSKKFKTTAELEAFLLDDDKSIGDVKRKLAASGLDEEAQKAVLKDIDKFSLAVGAGPAKADLPDVLQRLVDVLTRLEAKQQ